MLMSCSYEQEHRYFPLQKGLQWQYQVTVETPHAHTQYPLIMSNLGKKKLGDEEYYLRRSSLGIEYYLQYDHDTGGIQRVAKRTLNHHRPIFDQQAHLVLGGIDINQPQIVSEWVVNAQPYLLESTSTSKEQHNIRKSVVVPISYKVASYAEQVSTQAGMFENCIHIHGQGEVDVRRVLSIISDNIKFDVHEWYAPNVGLIKMTWSEIVKSSYNTGGEYQLELVSFEAR